jgi:hypothetical protein
MDPSKSIKCSSYLAQGKKCVSVFWESLDRTRSAAQEAIERDEAEIARAIAAIQRNRKILKLAKERATKKAWCLSLELEAEEEKERLANPDGKSDAEHESDTADLTTLSSTICEVD